MTRKNELSIVTVFTWFSNVVDTQQLKLGDIGLLMHIVKNLNRNFWKPLKMSVYKIAKSSGSDDRTIRGALKRLAEKNIIIQRDGEKISRIENPAEYFSTKKFKTNDSTSYFSIIQKNNEIFIGLESEETYFAKSTNGNKQPERTEQPAETAANPPGSPERNGTAAKVKSLADFM